MGNARIDQNKNSSLIGVSNADGTTILPVYVDSATNRLLVNATGTLTAGTEYTEGDTDATITGTAMMIEDTGNTLRALPGDTNGLYVGSITPATGALNLGKRVDNAAGSADVGVAPVAVRDDALGGLTPPEGDYNNLRVDANGALWTHDDALDAALSGSELQVDVVASLPAGTNAIGKLAANSGVDIGDVDILSIAAGDNNIGNVDIVTAPAIAAGTNAIGKLLPPDVDVTTHTNYAKKYYTNAGAVTDGIIWSPAAGKRWHVVSLFINVSAAATVTLEDDLGAGDSAIMKMELAANSGFTMNFGEKYPLASGEDAADLLITTSAGNVYVTITGYEV